MPRHVDSETLNDAGSAGLHDEPMPDLRELKDHDLQGLAPEAMAALAQQMLQRIREHERELARAISTSSARPVTSV